MSDDIITTTYRTALTKPPDGRSHPTFQHAKTQRSAGTPYNAEQLSQVSLDPLHRAITGHAFVGAYTQRFFPQYTPDQIA